jgi:hypothetical protein
MIQFADSVGNIQVFNQVVRIELLATNAPQQAGQPPVLMPAGHLIMPIDGLLKTFAALENTMRQLAEAGVIKRSSDGGAGAPEMPGLSQAMGSSAGGKKKRPQ